MNDFSVEEIWHASKAFNFFRGDDWMKEPKTLAAAIAKPIY
ncbi:hypothetical protein [Methylosoma difficile]